MQSPYEFFLSEPVNAELEEALRLGTLEAGKVREVGEIMLGTSLPDRWFSVFKAEAGIPFVLREDGLIDRSTATRCLVTGVWLFSSIRIADEVLDNQVGEEWLTYFPLGTIYAVEFMERFSKHCSDLTLDVCIRKMLSNSASAAIRRRCYRGSADDYLEINRDQNSYATIMAVSALGPGRNSENLRQGLLHLFAAYQVYDDYWDRKEDREADVGNIVSLFFESGDVGMIRLLEYAIQQCQFASDHFEKFPTLKAIANRARTTFDGLLYLMNF